jgi:hypothetical protein
MFKYKFLGIRVWEILFTCLDNIDPCLLPTIIVFLTKSLLKLSNLTANVWVTKNKIKTYLLKYTTWSTNERIKNQFETNKDLIIEFSLKEKKWVLKNEWSLIESTSNSLCRYKWRNFLNIDIINTEDMSR